MKLKKLLSLLTAAVLCLSVVSCSESASENGGADGENGTNISEPGASSAGSSSKVYSLANIKENIGDYSVVRGEKASVDVVNAAVLLRKTVNSACNVEIPITTDWDEAKDGAHEILVGLTSRDASKKAASELAEGKYSISEDDKGNIIIAGADDEAVSNAVAAFLMQYFGYEPEEKANKMNHNVKDYGAKGDSFTDDTGAFKKAIKAAEKDGLPVYVPAGTYVIKETLTLNSVTLYGYETGAWTADNCDLPTVKQDNMYAALFNVKGGSVSGLNIQAGGKKDDTKMKPSVLITGTGGRVSNMRIHTPYIGIYTDDTSNPGRCFIENIFIVEAKEMGVYVAGTYDVPCVYNVEVWNPGDTCPVAFKFGHNDDIRCVNLFAFKANVGFLIEKTDTGSCWGSFTNCSVDFTSVGFRIGEGDHHLTIVGGTYWTHHVGINVQKNSEAFVAASGCELKSNGERTLKIEGGKTVTVTGCSIIHKWEGDIPAVSVSGGKAVNITGNTIYSTATPIEVTSTKKNSAVSITNNVIYTASETEYIDKSRSAVKVKIDNLVTVDPDEFKD